MTRSPGQVRPSAAGERLEGRVEVYFNGSKVADSGDAIRIVEDGKPIYFLPRSDVITNYLKRTKHERPSNLGSAHQFTINVRGTKSIDAAWSLDAPHDDRLRERIAFDETKVDEIKVIEKGGETAPAREKTPAA